jgi:hypothetical protein
VHDTTKIPEDGGNPGPVASPSASRTAIAYVSSAVPGLGEPELEELLDSARGRNVQLGVTGVLLLHEGSFFQYFEGPTAGVEEVWGRIRRSRLHHGMPLLRAPIAQRVFPDWLMGFTRAPQSVLLQLANASWHSTVDALGTRARAGDGLALLLHFWTSSRPYESEDPARGKRPG